MQRKWMRLTAAVLTVTMLMGCQKENSTEVAVDNTNRTYYEVFVYSFYDSDGDGIGDLKGLTEKLDYINDGKASTDTDLGCNGLWLMPIMPSTTYHKYDVTDYKDIDPEYGTLEDFQALVDACHERGINVIIDLVMNHSSSKHPWFQEACEYMQSLGEGEEPDATVCPYVDYYNFTKEKKGGYVQIPDTDWYYEAQFWSEMPDLNLYSDAVREEFADITAFWLDLGVDGFRLDAAKEYVSDNVTANVEILTWFNDRVKTQKEDAYIVAEVWTDINTYGKYYESGINSCFDFAFAGNTGIIATVVNQAKPASAYGNALVNMQEIIGEYSDEYADAPFYTNHDLARGAGYYAGNNGESQAKIAQTMNLLMSGDAFLYYGEELGMKGSGKDENKRAPMYWSEDPDEKGMCNGPADMDSIKMKYGSLETQKEDAHSIYNYVKKVIWIRNHYEAISRGTVTTENELSGEDICVIRKTGTEDEIVLAFNISDQFQTVDVSALQVNDILVGEKQLAEQILVGEDQASIKDGRLELPPYGVVVLK